MPVGESPNRMTITDLQSDETITMQFNPQELQRSISVNYAKKAVLGNSHLEHEYLQTDNQGVRFDLFYLAETIPQLEALENSQRFLESLCYAPEDPESIAQAAPPRVLLVWPRTMSIIARLTRLDINNERWNRFGNVIQYRASCTWEESRITRLTKQDVRLLGALRVPQSQGKVIE